MTIHKSPMVLLLKYCLHHHTVVWHILCIGGVFQCLECFLEDRLDESLNLYEKITGRRP